MGHIERTHIYYHGTVVHVSPEGQYVVEQDDGSECLIEPMEEDEIELDELRPARQ
ncbi:MAG: hypothetical protein H0V66_08545 [Bdellovibrionales bacterium]|nr:hypothetical protein [Bdellovibrionales bacterium]